MLLGSQAARAVVVALLVALEVVPDLAELDQRGKVTMVDLQLPAAAAAVVVLLLWDLMPVVVAILEVTAVLAQFRLLVALQ